MTQQFAHLQHLLLRVVERTRHVEFRDTQALLLQQLPGFTLGEAAGHHDVGFQDQHVLGFARQAWKAARRLRGRGAVRVAGIRTEADDLLGVGSVSTS